jgi:hypothetical protein
MTSLSSLQLTEKYTSCNMRGNLDSSVEVWRSAEGVEVWGASEAYAGGVGGGASTLWDLVDYQVCGSAQDEERMILCNVCDGGTCAVRPPVHQYFLNSLLVLIAKLNHFLLMSVLCEICVWFVSMSVSVISFFVIVPCLCVCVSDSFSG